MTGVLGTIATWGGKQGAVVAAPVYPDLVYSAPRTNIVWGVFNPDGTWKGYGPNMDRPGINWYLPTTPSAGAGYWVRATLLSGTAPQSPYTYALDTWHSLSSSVNWGFITPAAGVPAECLLRYDISSTASGSSIVSSGTHKLGSIRTGNITTRANRTLTASTVGTNYVGVRIKFFSDGRGNGTISYGTGTGSGSGEYDEPWYTPAPVDSTLGQAYWIRALVISGNGPTGAAGEGGGNFTNTWLGLSSYGDGRYWDYAFSALDSNKGTMHGVLRIQIAYDNGATIVSSADYDITVTRS